MSHRKNKSTPSFPKEQRIAELEEQLAKALAAIEKLQRQNELLRVENEDLKRSGKRQATPFARRKWVTEPRKPGRKAGQGKFARREKPLAQQVNETKVARLGGCPECGHRLKAIRKHEQYVADIPVMVPVITRYVTYSGYCAECKKRVRSQHPEQISQAAGAAGVLVGPRAKALATDLKHRLAEGPGTLRGRLVWQGQRDAQRCFSRKDTGTVRAAGEPQRLVPGGSAAGPDSPSGVSGIDRSDPAQQCGPRR